jgi:AcrR family transcriptional regulator
MAEMTTTAAKTELTPETTRLPPRERILMAACDLFYRQGIRAVGVDAIAEAAGTNKMTLYRHFASKDELVAEYLRRLWNDKKTAWDKLCTEYSADPKGQLQAWLHEAAAQVTDPKSRGCAIANAAVELPEKDHPARCVIEQCKQHSRDRLVELCRAARIEQPELLADQLFMLLEGALVCTQATGRDGPADQFVRAGQALIDAHSR